MLSSALRIALDRRRIVEPLSYVARQVAVDPANLSRFARGVRSLAPKSLAALAEHLRIAVFRPGSTNPESGPLFDALRSAIGATGLSLRGVAKRTGIDPGNLNKFLRKVRFGLSQASSDHVCNALHLVVAPIATLRVQVLESGTQPARPLHKVLVEARTQMAGEECVLGIQTTNRRGYAQFSNVVLDADVDLFIAGRIVECATVLEESHEIAISF